MQVDPPSKSASENSPAYQSPPIQRPSSAVPIRPFAQPSMETAVGIASTVPYIPATSQTAKKEFGYVQKRLRKTSMDVAAMVCQSFIITDFRGENVLPTSLHMSLPSQASSSPTILNPIHIPSNQSRAPNKYHPSD